ncbi:MAG: 4'-phosphopantetheinyl transferase superfamily protein [Curvibacter sp.]|nr:4'-phosphopantetheinyl transferase superfamily protein [Curvibacter sp.]
MTHTGDASPPTAQPCESGLVRALFAIPVQAMELRDRGLPAWLLPEERDSIAGAVPSRIEEFAAGRRCARDAMRAFGLDTPGPLRRGPHREPLWPAGLVGSITHTEGFCAAVVASARACAGLGIDAERCGRLGPGLWPLLFDATEQAALRALSPPDQDRLATVLFAAKEALFKSQFALSAAVPEFTDVCLRLAAPLADSGSLELVAVRDARLEPWAGRSRFRYALQGPFALAGALIVSPA